MSDEPRPRPPIPGWARQGDPNPGSAGSEGAAPSGRGGRRRRTGARRLLPTWRMVLGGVAAVAVLLVGGFFLGYHLVKIPSANALATRQNNIYLYADGTVLARDGEVNRENVALSRVSEAARHAVLAAEDRDFYSTSGVDPQAMLRAAWNTATGKGRQSGSTITQQYVKNYYLVQEQTVTRKVKEFFIAIKLDRETGKDDILEGYLNTSYFGRGAYGVQAAAHAYYGIDAADLDAGQGAYLASLLNAPSRYDVVTHPENRPAAVRRWNYVLDGMVEQGWLGPARRASLSFPDPDRTTAPNSLSGQRGYVVQIVKEQLAADGVLREGELEAGGYRITTTLREDAQDAFVAAVEDRLMSRLDDAREADSYVRAGGAAVDPRSGEVVALYNGVDYVKQYTPNATRRDFQVGSTFKPFVLASALENDAETQDGRSITPATRYDGTSERTVQGWSGQRYAPENEDHRDYGDITVREATDKSVNAVYAQMAADVGSDRVEETAVALGLSPDTPELVAAPSIALGTATASPLDMAKAYATLANHGRHAGYTLIERITRGGQDVPLPSRPDDRQVIGREAADTTTWVLRGVVERGTATAARAAGRPAAGKTGTAEEDTAAWFAGYTPELATVVAVMGQDPDTAAHKSLYGVMGLGRINGGGVPAEIWAQFTREALSGTPVTAFDLRVRRGVEESGGPSDRPSGSDRERDTDEEDRYGDDDPWDTEPGDGAWDSGPAATPPGATGGAEGALHDRGGAGGGVAAARDTDAPEAVRPTVDAPGPGAVVGPERVSTGSGEDPGGGGAEEHGGPGAETPGDDPNPPRVPQRPDGPDGRPGPPRPDGPGGPEGTGGGPVPGDPDGEHAAERPGDPGEPGRLPLPDHA